MSSPNRAFQYVEGRRYHDSNGKETYFMPNDEAEAARLDNQHEVWRMSMNGNLYISPIEISPGFRVLDVGTGTGVWAIEFAQNNPSSQVIGTDLSAIQPTESVPTNCQFYIANAENDWEPLEPFDFIHSRLLLAGIHDWPSYFRRCFSNLKPGGWVEAQEVLYPVRCNDDSAGSDSALIRWSRLVQEAMAKGGYDAAPGNNFKKYLLDQGFVNVQEKVIQWPCGPWPEDEAGRKLGRLSKKNILLVLEAVGLMLFMKQLGWTKKQVDTIVQEARKDLDDLGKQFYMWITVHCAQKPVERQSGKEASDLA